MTLPAHRPPSRELSGLAALEASAALVHRVLPPTPQIRWPLLCARSGAEVWVKHENHQPVGAFKVRGGIVYMEELRQRYPDVTGSDVTGSDVTGVIAATRGNHGQSVAFAAARAGLGCVIVVPHGNSREKNAAMRALGAEIVEHGHDFQDAYEHAVELAAARHLHMVRSFEDALVRGVASYALELFAAVPKLETVYVPIGLGSGICATIAVRDALGLATEVIGVVAEAALGYALSFAAGTPISSPVAPTIADGMAVRVPDAEALKIILKGASRIVTVSEEEIAAAMRHFFTDTHNVAEGAGAAALAALLQERERQRGRTVAVILTGGNVDADVFARILRQG